MVRDWDLFWFLQDAPLDWEMYGNFRTWAGKYGGAAFILIYLVFLVLLGLPVLVCEFAVGRASRKSTARAFHDLEPEGANFHNFSYMSMISNYVLMMFYTMVAGWMLYYCYATQQGSLPERILHR